MIPIFLTPCGFDFDYPGQASRSMEFFCGSSKKARLELVREVRSGAEDAGALAEGSDGAEAPMPGQGRSPDLKSC